VIDQSAIRGLKRSLLAGLDGGVAYKRLDAHDGSDLKLAWIVYQLTLLSNWLQSARIMYWWLYIAKLIAIRIVYRWMSMVVLMVGLTVGSTVGSMVGLMVGLTVGSTMGSTWLYWAINLSKAFDSSEERLNELLVLQTCFTGSSFYGLFNGYQPRGRKGY
jgi:hypothetical protein